MEAMYLHRSFCITCIPFSIRKYLSLKATVTEYMAVFPNTSFHSMHNSFIFNWKAFQMNFYV